MTGGFGFFLVDFFEPAVLQIRARVEQNSSETSAPQRLALSISKNPGFRSSHVKKPMTCIWCFKISRLGEAFALYGQFFSQTS
ncbi:MAG: hypothetical protein LBG43_01585 [Treponema sp.]|nr:hypothetical protein [Treponema sp.]